ncbi:HET-domain-containing protein [Whalleya microplaca]|nr:HET-domain-containing protein [Whalleya microplaca]
MRIKTLTRRFKSTYQKTRPLSIDGSTTDVNSFSDRIPAYPYRELPDKEIRLLRILPGTGCIECVLDQVPESPRPFYYAVSYVWGNANEKRTILLEGMPFQVTKNLYEALYQFRQCPDVGDIGQYYWVDAICMDQDNSAEKSRLVPRMVDIYQLGVLVLAWLGPNGPPAGGIIKRVFQTATLFRRRTPTECLDKALDPKGPSPDNVIKDLFDKAASMWLEWDPVDEDDNIVISSVLGSSYPVMVRAVMELLGRPWFSRVWTFQEACLKPNVTLYAGGHRLDMDQFMFFFKILRMQHRFVFTMPGSGRVVAVTLMDEIFRHILVDSDSENNLRRKEPAEIFIRLYAIATKKQSSDPRDQIYGLVGLLRSIKGGELPAGLRPDYTHSCDEVYWNCAAYLFDATGDLRLLNCDNNRLRDAPSWVPDFRSIHHGPGFRREATVSVSPDKRILTVQGISLGTFCDYIPRCIAADTEITREMISDGVARRIKDIEERIIRPSATLRGIGYEETLDSLFMVVVELLDEGGIPSLRRVFRRLSEPVCTEKSRPAKRNVTNFEYFREDCIKCEIRRQFLLLPDGTIITVNRYDADVRPGDLVCIFKGAPMPSLVRPSGEAYTFVSQCKIRSGTFDQEEFGDDFWTDREVREFRLV